MNQHCKQQYDRWISDCALSEHHRDQLKMLTDEQIEDAFYTELDFGTAGIRGIVGMGSNRMNEYAVRRVCAGFAAQLGSHGGKKICICYDGRRDSQDFAQQAACVFASNGISVLMFSAPRPTPQLSFAILHHRASGGINITASHNPPQYNGIKFYGQNGAQIPDEQADEIAEHYSRLPEIAPRTEHDFEHYLAQGAIAYMPESEDFLYYEALFKSLPKCPPPPEDFKIVYSALHGVGGKAVMQVLKDAGFKNVMTVAQQFEPDGDFSTVKSANPEDKEALKLAIELAQKHGAHMVIATDGDGDRVGIALPNREGNWEQVSGNATGALLIDFLLTSLTERGEMPENPAVIKTIVTTDLAEKVAQMHGASCFETFTGFKFMAEKADALKAQGEYSFLMAYEESFGYMIGDHCRDKDGVVGALMLAQMGAQHHKAGSDINKALEGLWQKCGYHAERTVNLVLPGSDGAQKIQLIMQRLRTNPPEQIGGMTVQAVHDYMEGTGELSGSDVLRFDLEGGCKMIVRPSGTEPKIKIYALCVGVDAQQAQQKAQAIADFANTL